MDSVPNDTPTPARPDVDDDDRLRDRHEERRLVDEELLAELGLDADDCRG